MDQTVIREQTGPRTRDLRRRLGLTLDQLATEAGLSTGHLSRFERGEKSLSLAALMRLARALDTTVGVLLGEALPEEDVSIVRAGTILPRRVEDGGGAYDFVALGQSVPGRTRHETFLVTLPQSARRTSTAFHAGHELLYLLAGRMRVRVGNRDFTLESGDYMEFPGHYQHEIESLAGEGRLLIVVLDDA